MSSAACENPPMTNERYISEATIDRWLLLHGQMVEPCQSCIEDMDEYGMAGIFIDWGKGRWSETDCARAGVVKLVREQLR